MLRRLSAFMIAGVAVIAGCGAGSDSTNSGSKDGNDAKGVEASQPTANTAAKKGLKLVRIGDFDVPVYVDAPPNDKRRIFIVEQPGRIKVRRGGKLLKRSFLDIRSKVSFDGERGLLSMAFAPDYESSRKFYVNYTNNSGDTRVVEYQTSSSNADRANKGSARVLLKIKQPYENHNGGQLQFGPDGLLYIGMGDGGSGGDPDNNAQRLGSWLGKMLRIDPAPSGGKPYTVPSSNPFVGKSGARPEIYSYGLRNPWRFSFDSKTKALYIGDVGQDKYEELDYTADGKAKGANFGWSAYEGRSRFRDDVSAPNSVKPILVTKLSAGNCSIMGGYVVHNKNIPALNGRYIFGDFCKPNLRSLKVKNGKATSLKTHKLKVSQLSSFGVDARNRIYATSLDGPVYRISSR